MAEQQAYKNFQEFCERWDRREKDSYASRFLKHGKSALTLALEEAKKSGLNQRRRDLIEKVEEIGMLDGSFELTYEGAERIYKKLENLVRQKGSELGKDYLQVIQNFDPVRDSDLIATGIFCLSPEIREKLGRDLGSLYKVVLNVGTNRKKGYALPEKQEKHSVSGDNFFPYSLKELLASLPKPESDEDSKYQRALHVLVQKKAERDVFPAFKQGEVQALSTLEKLASQETDENIRQAYSELADTYRKYLDFNVEGVNPNFTDPQTGARGVLPSLHQKIGIYHLVHEGRFGIWDGGGTGKTAIAVLAQPLIEKEMERQGKKFRRAIVVCPNLAKKAWRKGLLGNEHERYLEEKQDAVVIDGDKKDDTFIDEISKRKWIVLNYEQLTTRVNGSDKLFIDDLVERGVDYVIFDESHNIKALRERTKKGRPSHSAASRMLALNSEYFAPMSATPISNGIVDFAVQYHLLNPAILPDPEKFTELIQGSPRVLYTFFNERSVRRTSEDINEDLDWNEKEHMIQLDELQKTIYNHIIEFRPTSWLQQARKSLLDPRLVDPEILYRAGVIGEVSVENSSKYKKLEELLSSNDGPITNNEKFIVFSTMFREGVTQRGNSKLQSRYEKLGLPEEYERLQLEKSLDVILKESLERKFGKEIEMGIIDGTITSIQRREQIVENLNDGLVGIICTTETGGESLDFTAANHVYFLDEDYVPDTEQQALWRLIRKGQKRKVHINHLRTEDTLDEANRDYVDKKRIIAKMAMDGVPPTEEEWSILGDTEGQRFGDLIRRKVGGVSINVYDAKIENISDFEIKKRTRGTRKPTGLVSTIYETTIAQEINAIIGRDKFGCWQKPEFVEKYVKALPNLAPPVLHTAKICDLVERSLTGQINFPRSVVSEGSGPSILYDSYRTLRSLLKANGIKVPKIVDRDTSQPMLDKGENPNKVLACMTGKDSPFKRAQFDMVDNESVSLLKNSDEVHAHLLEANRILKQNGLLELIVKNIRFSDEFYSGIADLGFELISGKNQGFNLSKDAFRRLRKTLGEHFAESYAAKLANTYLLLAKRVDNPGKANPENFWFETLSPDEPEEEQFGDLDGMGKSILYVTPAPKVGWQTNKTKSSIPRYIKPDDFVPKRVVTVDGRTGLVKSVKKIGE